jgi:hypothetical protein
MVVTESSHLLQLQVDGYGINSLADFFTDFGYEPREELRFPAKKLRALWFSPPKSDGYTGTGIYGPLPRIFISELLVDELSAPSQVVLDYLINLFSWSTTAVPQTRRIFLVKSQHSVSLTNLLDKNTDIYNI